MCSSSSNSLPKVTTVFPFLALRFFAPFEVLVDVLVGLLIDLVLEVEFVLVFGFGFLFIFEGLCFLDDDFLLEVRFRLHVEVEVEVDEDANMLKSPGLLELFKLCASVFDCICARRALRRMI